MDKNNQLEIAYKFCFLLKNEAIKEEIETCLMGYSLNDIKLQNAQFECTFIDKNKNTISLSLSPKMIHLHKYQNNVISSITIMEDQILRQIDVEKRSEGVIFTEIEKQFAPSTRFKNKIVLVNLCENRYVFSRENINKIIGKDDYENISPMYILFKLKRASMKSKLEDICDFSTRFSTYMNYYANWEGGKKIKDNIFPTRTYLNEEEVSNIFDVNDGPDKLYRVFDLYRGIINHRNEDDINSINLGFLSPDAFDFKGLRGITEKENNLVGCDNSEISIDYINYLSQLFNDKFGYKGEITIDRENLLKAITYKMSGPELAKRTDEKKLGIPMGEDHIITREKINKQIDKLAESGPKRLLKRIFKRR